MVPQSPSIQSFSKSEMSIPRQSSTVPYDSGDGFTIAELEMALHPATRSWEPRKQYHSLQIDELTPGPQYVTVTGRVINLYDSQKSSQLPYGCSRALVRDDTGVLLVRLWYAKIYYQLCLGQLVKIWTTNISLVESGGGTSSIQSAIHSTTLHPERNANCHFEVDKNSENTTLLRKPLGYDEGEQLAGLMTLKNYFDGGHEVIGSKILLCVKSIGSRKQVTTKKGIELELLNVIVFDDTQDAMLSLCGGLTASAASWETGHTLLLLSNPDFRIEKRLILCVNFVTQVDVDPDMKDAHWLRAFAKRLNMKEAINVPFPDGEDFMGYLSVVVLEMNIVAMHQRHKLFCAEWYIGTLIDETGAISSGKLVLSTEAWEQLLGRTAGQLARTDAQELNVIAIHGLGGDAFTTWTDQDGHMWLRDTLPRNLPHSKIWTYGYDSAVAWSGSVSGIQDFARDLLERLLGIQTAAGQPERPQIFICHSLGGIVIKRALVSARALPVYDPVRRNVKAIVFMGTPHKGSRLSSYLTPLSRIINGLIPTSPIRSDLIGNLQVLSRTLSEVTELSVQALNEITVVSFYEQKRLKGVNSLAMIQRQQVVEPASAILGNERAIPINADHRSMVRFSPHEPEKYRPVKNVLKGIVGKIEADTTPDSKTLEYLQKLHCIDYENLLTESTQPYTGTGTWLFESRPFRHWATEARSSMCLVRGHAGFGKTVIARSIVENSKLRTDRVVDLAPFGTSVVLHYFFRNDKPETVSQLSLLRSLLHQLLLAFPNVWSTIEYHHNKTVGASAALRGEFDYRSEWLWNALEDVLGLQTSEHALLVLDGLDEADAWEASSILKELLNMTRSLNESLRRARIKILVFSRPNYDIEKQCSGKHVTLLEMGRDQTLDDLRTFVSAIVPDYGRDNHFPESAISKIQDRILIGANGMFLWAHLAWEHFKEGVIVWSREKINSQLDSLGQLPRGLGKLYGRLLKSIDKRARAELDPIFALVCAAARQLGCDELGEFLAMESWHRNASEIDAPFAIEATLLKLCPNLFKIDLNGTVSFVHLSLKTFLLEELLQLDSHVIHRDLARKCLQYLGLEDFKRDVIVDARRSQDDECFLRQRYVLYDYCASFLKFHMEQVPYTDPIWLKYAKIVQNPDVFHAISEPNHGMWSHATCGYSTFHAETPLRHVLRLDALDLVRSFILEGYDVDEHLSSSTALHKYFGDRKKASLLLEMGANPNATDGMYRTVLHLAISCQNLNLVKEFLSLPDIDVNAQDTRGDTPLHYQVSLGSFPTLLYDPRVDVNQLNRAGLSPLATSALWGDKTTFQDFVECPGFTLGTDPGTLSPLICAAQQDWKDLTLQLLTKVPDASTHRGLDGKGIVHWAVINEWDDVLQAAVTHAKAKVNATDYSGKTGLHYAAQLGLYKMVRQLLRHGASARSQDNFGRTPVHTAAVEGFADVLRPLLLESDFDPDDADQQKRCVVHWAASCDWDYLMKIVLELPEIDVKKRDHHGRTASHVAALCGCPNVLRVMIEYDVFDASDTDAFSNTSLHLAARGQSLTAVEILLPHFAMFKDRVNRWGQTARDVAVAYGSHEIEAILRHEGFRIKAPPVTRIGASYKPLYEPELPYHQTPDHLALVRYDLERARRAYDESEERTESRDRRIPERRKHERDRWYFD
ncbi:MAG: hypothetical protein Q9228_002753 [Teloschistes exilis]